MNAEDLLILGAIGVGIWYVMNQSTTAAAVSGTPAPLSPVVPQAPTINVQPSTIPLSNPISSAAPAAVSPFSPAPAPPVPVMAIPPPPIGVMQSYPVMSGPVPGPTSGPTPYAQPSPTASGPIPPSPTVQPGVITTTSAPVASIQVAPSPYLSPVPAPPSPTVQPGIVQTVAAPPAQIVVAPPVATSSFSNTFNPATSWIFGSGPTGTLRGGYSKGGNVLTPGDTWSIQITGALPNSAVILDAKQNGSPVASVPMGITDSSGNFKLTGPTQGLGQWSYTWSVGGQVVGTMNFGVSGSIQGLRGGWLA